MFLTSCGMSSFLNSILSSDASYNLSLKTTNLSMKVGDNPIILDYVLTSSSSETFDSTIEWTSNNESVATVSRKGYVSPKGVGEATITASLKIDPSVKACCKVTVSEGEGGGGDVVQEISVTLSTEKQSIKQGQSYQLSASVKNYRTTNKVTWSGSANGISVDNTGLVNVSASATVGATATIVATSDEDSTKSASCVVTVLSGKEVKTEYTIMLYMCASTLEHDADQGGKIGLFSGDILEILSVKNIPESLKIIIETGGTKKWYMPSSALDGATSVSNSKLQRWEVIPASSSYSAVDPYSTNSVLCYNKLKLIDTLSTNKMSQESSFESFLEWGLKDYSADQMGLIISGHGGGVDGCAYDDNNDQISLNTANVAAACKNALKTSDKNKFTWIGYDCCMMAGIDNASVNADYFEYMVASQETENGTGYNHDVYLNEIVKNPKISPQVLLDKIAKSFVDENHSDCPYPYLGQKYYCYQTTSVIDLSKVDAIVNAFDNSSIVGDYTKAETAFKASKLNSFGESCYGLVDLNCFLTSYANKNSGVEVNNIVNAVNDAVISNYYCSKYSPAPCGLNLFFPESLDSRYEFQVEEESYTGNQTKLKNWQTLCLQNGSFYSSSGSGSGGGWYLGW